METHATLTELLAALKVFGSIQHGQRLNTKGTTMSVEYQTTYNAFWRWFGGENRTDNIKTIHDYLNRTFMLIDQSIKDKGNQIMLARILSSLENAEKGLQRLKTTYTQDAHTKAKIVLAIENILIYKQKLVTTLAPYSQNALIENVVEDALRSHSQPDEADLAGS